MSKPFAIVTGASSGIGLELATICAQEDLICGLSQDGRALYVPLLARPAYVPSVAADGA